MVQIHPSDKHTDTRISGRFMRSTIAILFAYVFFFALLQQGYTEELGPQLPETHQYADTAVPHKQREVQPIPVYRSTTVLPLFSKQLGLTEENTPLPFSIALFGNYMQSKIVTSNLRASTTTNVHLRGEDLKNAGILKPPLSWIVPNGLDIIKGEVTVNLSNIAELAEVKQSFTTAGARFVVNVMPFWSVYGIFANTTGTVSTAVTLNRDITGKDVNLPPILPTIPGLEGLVKPFLDDMVFVKQGTIPFTIEHDVYSVGAGTNVALGGKLFFISVDANYVMSIIPSMDIKVHTVNASSRVGLFKKVDNQFFSLWVGGNYMDNIGGSDKLGASSSLEKVGDLLPLGDFAQTMMGDAAASFSWVANQRPLNVFTALVGVRYSPFPNFDIVSEVQFIDKIAVMVSASFNF